MASRNHIDPIIQRLLERHGRTFADELHIRLDRPGPSTLFRLLCFSLLASARISWELSLKAAHALTEQGWTTPRKMADATWRQRTDVLNHSGYARYDESTSRMLESTSRLLLDEYAGDLRKLREQAGRDPAVERRRLRAFKGMGDVGVDIFAREVQVAWDEWHPFMDKLSIKAADQLGLPTDPHQLAKHVPREQFPRLVTALVRTHLENDYVAVQPQPV